MSAVDELTEALIAAGKTPGEAAALLARAHAEMAAPVRSKGADRTARWRAKRASQAVTERHSVTPEIAPTEASPSVTNRHKASHCDAAHIYTLPSLDKDSIKKEEVLEGPRTRRPSRIPDDWQLDQKHIDYALAKGVAADRIPMLGEKFKAHWQGATGKGSTSPNWFKKWCTWVINDLDWNGGRKGNATPQVRPQQPWQQRRDDWFGALDELTETVAAADTGDEGGSAPLRLVIPAGRG